MGMTDGVHSSLNLPQASELPGLRSSADDSWKCFSTKRHYRPGK
jgi:hypothetical protein